MKGALIFVEKWGMNVLHVKQSGKYKAIIKIDLLRVLGGEQEGIIGRPGDFNSFWDVQEVLLDTNRHRYSVSSKYSDFRAFDGLPPASSLSQTDVHQCPDISDRRIHVF